MRFILPLALLLGCQTPIVQSLPQYPVTPYVAVQSTFKVTTLLDGVAIKFGTAWSVELDQGNTYLVSAGHVCSAGEEIVPGIIAIPEGKVTHRVTSQHSESWAAELVAEAADPDLCLLKVPSEIATPLNLDTVEPKWGTFLSYVGAPIGMFGDGVAMVYEGRYSGKNYVAIPTAGGASGSAVFGARGVVGVIVRVARGFDSVTKIVPTKEVIAFVERAKTN